ncbi:MAG: ABC transporter permease [Bacilli bacterium]|jgi:4-amino-4-deoxy-L-arabinose transferase-like glycosyltransferase|nr:ABC transporter permease [Bacilli bacterium]MCH4201687.1 ABC transporter permease [Bacilli bacterium]MCH4235269.1 ABC transporter permease [Bacilli bacterium]
MEYSEKFRPMSSWGYFGYQILFSIPLIGFISLIIFALDSSYIARRNFARSYFCFIILVLIVVFIMFQMGFLADLLQRITQ